jgi:hypothetical protein
MWFRLVWRCTTNARWVLGGIPMSGSTTSGLNSFTRAGPSRGGIAPAIGGIGPYTDAVKSRLAGESRRRRFERVAAMTPADRVALAARLGVAGLESYMATHGVDRSEAVARIQATRRAGRRRSASDLADAAH